MGRAIRAHSSPSSSITVEESTGCKIDAYWCVSSLTLRLTVNKCCDTITLVMTKDEMRAAVTALPEGPSRLQVAVTLSGVPAIRLAAKAGINRSTFSMIANGHVEASADQQRAISRVLGLTVADLFGAAA